MLSRLHLTVALLVLAGAATMLAITPDGLTGAGFAIGGWVTVIAAMLCVISALAHVGGTIRSARASCTSRSRSRSPPRCST